MILTNFTSERLSSALLTLESLDQEEPREEESVQSFCTHCHEFDEVIESMSSWVKICEGYHEGQIWNFD
ncbi:MAG TPA: hypothetical protein VI146_04010 [Nitrososphaeraceae archaeon]